MIKEIKKNPNVHLVKVILIICNFFESKLVVVGCILFRIWRFLFFFARIACAFTSVYFIFY